MLNQTYQRSKYLGTYFFKKNYRDICGDMLSREEKINFSSIKIFEGEKNPDEKENQVLE